MTNLTVLKIIKLVRSFMPHIANVANFVPTKSLHGFQLNTADTQILS